MVTEHSDPQTPAWPRHKFFATAMALLAILALAAGVRALHLGESIYYDEIITMRHMDAASIGEFWHLQWRDDPPSALAPIYFTVHYFWRSALGSSIPLARGLDLVFGVISIALAFDIGRRLFGSRAGLTAALIASLSLSHIYYSVELRIYPLVLCLGAASLDSFVAWDMNGGWRRLAIHTGVNALLLASHLLTAPFIIAQGLFLCVFAWSRGRQLRAWLPIHGLLLATTGLIAFYPLGGAGKTAFWMERPGAPEIVNAFVVFSGARFTNWAPHQILLGALLSFIIPFLMAHMILTAGLPQGVRRRSDSGPPMYYWTAPPYFLLLICAFFPPLFLFAVSYIWKPMFLYRYALYSTIPLYVYIGAMGRSGWKNILCICVICVLLAFEVGILRYPWRPDYHAAADCVQQEGAPADAIFAMKEYNTSGLIRNSTLPPGRIETVYGKGDLYDRVWPTFSKGRDVWVLFWRWDDEMVRTFRAFLDNHDVKTEQKVFGGAPTMRLIHLRHAGRAKESEFRSQESGVRIQESEF